MPEIEMVNLLILEPISKKKVFFGSAPRLPLPWAGSILQKAVPVRGKLSQALRRCFPDESCCHNEGTLPFIYVPPALVYQDGRRWFNETTVHVLMRSHHPRCGSASQVDKPAPRSAADGTARGGRYGHALQYNKAGSCCPGSPFFCQTCICIKKGAARN